MIGIQHSFDLLGSEASIFQVAAAFDGDRQYRIGSSAKLLAISAYGEIAPIALDVIQCSLDHFRARAALLEFRRNASWPVTAFRARSRIGFRVARIALQVREAKFIEDLCNVRGRMAAGFQLARQLDFGMLAARERRQRLRPQA